MYGSCSGVRLQGWVSRMGLVAAIFLAVPLVAQACNPGGFPPSPPKGGQYQTGRFQAAPGSGVQASPQSLAGGQARGGTLPAPTQLGGQARSNGMQAPTQIAGQARPASVQNGGQMSGLVGNGQQRSTGCTGVPGQASQPGQPRCGAAGQVTIIVHVQVVASAGGCTKSVQQQRCR